MCDVLHGKISLPPRPSTASVTTLIQQVSVWNVLPSNMVGISFSQTGGMKAQISYQFSLIRERKFPLVPVSDFQHISESVLSFQNDCFSIRFIQMILSVCVCVQAIFAQKFKMTLFIFFLSCFGLIDFFALNFHLFFGTLRNIKLTINTHTLKKLCKSTSGQMHVLNTQLTFIYIYSLSIKIFRF